MDKKFYTLDKILECDAQINVAMGQKGNGKSTAILEFFLKHYIDTGNPFIVLRRWNEDIKASRAKTIFADIVGRGKVAEWTDGEWNNVVYYQSAWYLAKWDATKGKSVRRPEPFAWARSLTNYEHDNGTQFPPNLYGVFFDEFISANELPDEFTEFMLVYDTLKRRRDDFKIFLAGNTINLFSSYWDFFGVDVRKMEQGHIYTSELEDKYKQKVRIAIEYCSNIISESEKSVISVFAQNNEKLRMIIDGSWMIGKYPQIKRYLPKEKLFSFYIQFHEFTFVCDVVQREDEGLCLCIRKYTRDIDDDEYLYTDIIDANAKHLHVLGNDKISQLFRQLYITKKVFYDSNYTGNVIESWYNTVC